MKLLLNIVLSGILVFVQADKERVSFLAADGLTVTADHYLVNQEYPYILLFHMAGSSRGEYLDIAGKLTMMNYNCLAVDLRSGKNANFINNETARMARQSDKSTRMIEARKDIEGAISYAYNLSLKPVILFGSSYSASLCLLEGQSNELVRAVIAFSPGEFFGDDLRVQQELRDFEKPLFVASTQFEKPYIQELLSNVKPDRLTVFQPSDSPGIHGAKALWESNESKDEYWLALLLFFNSLQ